MGAQAQATNGCLPVMIEPAALMPAVITPDIASAQVKSAILLAALGVAGTTIVREKIATRGHSETMLRLMGADIRVQEKDGYSEVSLHNENGPTKLKATDLHVPGDPSSAAFPLGCSAHRAGLGCGAGKYHAQSPARRSYPCFARYGR